MKTITISNKIFKEVKENTKKGEEIINRYYNYKNYDSLYKCYEKPSQEKFNIFNKWLKFYYTLNDRDGFYISSFNKFNFTLVFRSGDYIFYITPSNNYYVKY